MSDQLPAAKAPGEMTRAEQESRIAQLKAEATIPILEAARDVIQQWAKDGTLHQELHNSKLKGVVNDIAKLIAALAPRGPAIIMAPAPAPGDSKDPLFYRKESATNMTDAERQRRREGAIDAEVVKE